MKKVQILIGPIQLPRNFDFDLSMMINPGMGGSEFHSILLSEELSKYFDVSLWITKGSLVSSGNFKIINTIDSGTNFALQIAFTSNANTLDLEDIPLIALSHHPFDGNISTLPDRTLAIANVGRFQLLSNAQSAKKINKPQYWFPVFLGQPLGVSNKPRYPDKLKAGHVSSLHPSKGFHDVLRGWNKFFSKDNGKLTVIGGVSLYGTEETHEKLPVSRKYGKKLTKILRRKAETSVEFLGVIPGDISHEVSKWDVAILNPKAWGESESVSMKDCWRAGVPVIAGNRFGQRDYMKYFPELQAASPRKIKRVLVSLHKNPDKLVYFSKRSLAVYRELVARGDVSRQAWSVLVTKASSVKKINGNFGVELGPITFSDKYALTVDKTRQFLHDRLIKAASNFKLAKKNV